MKKAIETKYLPCNNTKGPRIKAYAEGDNSITISYPHESRNPHADAALALARKMGWKGTLVSGGKADWRGRVFCFLDSDKFTI
jgi:hypothetical protein